MESVTCILKLALLNESLISLYRKNDRYNNDRFTLVQNSEITDTEIERFDSIMYA